MAIIDIHDGTFILYTRSLALNLCSLLIDFKFQSLSHDCYLTIAFSISEGGALHLLVLSAYIYLHDWHFKLVLGS